MLTSLFFTSDISISNITNDNFPLRGFKAEKCPFEFVFVDAYIAHFTAFLWFFSVLAWVCADYNN